MIEIIIINGTGGVGKDTFVELCKEYALKLPYMVNIYNYSTITPIKQIAYGIGWTGTKTEKDRKFLSDLKDLLTQYNDYPYQCIKDIILDIKEHKTKTDSIVFIHCREPNEIQRFVNDFNAKSLLIRRSQIKPANNHADMEVENFNYDYIINNDDSIKELKNKAASFINNILKKD